ncbi:MAG TPA: SDR family NAD(P)-dependent oxidoreductase [Pseudonocardiaceae bacterium]|jgi:NAD(P)-dependent dehydrogenase (short-subunit alcohol dehydrogenase family)|nr:SDR family NAD(P)-dependent oxidoreductase [Pseudonocardiaceae bacterium]
MSAARRTTLVLGATGRVGGEIARRMVGLSSTLLLHGADPAETALLGGELAGVDDNCRVISLPADFTQLRAARELTKRALGATGEIDVVVNAVDLRPPPTRVVTEDGNELTWQVNYLGPALIMLGVLPLLHASRVGRMIQLVGDAHPLGVPKANMAPTERRYYPSWSYTECKLALMMFSQSVAGRLGGSLARSLAMQPAGVEVSGTQLPLSRALMVDAVLYACTSQGIPNGAYLRGRRIQALPRAAAGVATQQRMWRTTCRILGIDVRTGEPLGNPYPVPTPAYHHEYSAGIPVT